MARKGLYDLTFFPGTANELGIMLNREFKGGSSLPARYKGGYTPTEIDDTDTIQTVPLTQDDFSGGALYSKTVIKNGYAYMAPGYARSPRGVTPPGEVTTTTLPALSPTIGNITDSYEIGGDLYFMAGRYALVSANSNSNTLTVAQDLGTGFVADGAALFNGSAYIGGSGGNIWKCTSSGVFTQSADVSHRKAGTVTWLVPSEGAMLPRLVMADSTLKGIRYTGGDPMVLANWTPNPSFISIGDSTYEIGCIVTAPNHFYIGKRDGLYDLNTRGETPCLTPYWQQTAISSRNAATGFYHAGYVHLAHAQGSDRINVTRLQRQHTGDWTLPPYGVVNETPVVGPVVSYALDQGWLMTAVYNVRTDTTYIGAGRNRGEPGVPDGPGAMLWHFAEQVVDGVVTHMTVRIVDDQARLWVASQRGPDRFLTWQYLPAATNPVGERSNTAFRFGTAMTIYTTPFDWQQPDTLKVLRLMGIRAEGLGVAANIAVSANAEGGAYTAMGTASTSPRTRITPRQPLTQGYEIGLRLDGTGGATTPPVLRAVKLDAELQNEQFDRRMYQIRVGRQQMTHGGVDTRNSAVVWEDIAELHRSGVVEMRDSEGSLLTVRAHPIREYNAVEDDVAGRFTRSGTLPITVLEIQSGASVGTGATWGDGTLWGEGNIYGASA